MKKILSLTFVLLLITSCVNNNERKAKKLIKEHLKATMNDYSSYESMAFFTLDTSFSKVVNDPTFKSLISQHEDAEKERKYWENKLEEIDNRNKVYGRIVDKRGPFIKETILSQYEADCLNLSKEIDSVRSHFKPNFIGYQMTHEFRGANAFGGKIIGMMTFYFDKEITTVIDVVDLNEKLRNIPE
jgi:hypothetical protein